ncbi:MAG: thiopurine S-methyltransferase [Hyphomicrobiaceae bacterium]
MTLAQAIEHEFWHERWRAGHIGFHDLSVNKLLMKHWPRVCPDPTAGVFVPLCGKSLDMVWLAERGHAVIGVELSDIAIRDFFSERDLTPDVVREGAFEVWRGGPFELWCGDFFELPHRVTARVAAAYDRASLIALPTDLRPRYAAHMAEIAPRDATTLLQTIAYDQAEMEGPPFSVSPDEVERLYAGLRKVQHLETRDALEGSKNLQARGLTALTTTISLIGPRVDGRTAEADG